MSDGPFEVIRECPVSRHPLRSDAVRVPYEKIGVGWKIDCQHCGPFVVDIMEYGHLPGYFMTEIPGAPTSQQVARYRAVLAHAIRRMSINGQLPILRDGMALRILKEDRLPNLAEQRDNILRWFAAEAILDRRVEVSFEQLGAIAGAASQGAFLMLLGGMAERGLIRIDRNMQNTLCGLAFPGLERVEELERAEPSGFSAFMAMRFGDDRFDNLINDHFRPATQEAGFELYRLDDRPKAGLIDARLRNEIRNCRFLIADLSHANAGAYWEAGYAEGLGKPVIYTCEKDVFDGNSQSIAKPHFDTNHHLTIVWEWDKLPIAAQQLKDTIRFTIPEALQQDRKRR